VDVGDQERIDEGEVAGGLAGADRRLDRAKSGWNLPSRDGHGAADMLEPLTVTACGVPARQGQERTGVAIKPGRGPPGACRRLRRAPPAACEAQGHILLLRCGANGALSAGPRGLDDRVNRSIPSQLFQTILGQASDSP
jgi:hypothetical protein